MVIIPKKYDASKVRLKIKKEMAEQGKDSILVPQLTTLYDIALDLAGVGKGAVIMMEDFFCLLDQIEGLPQKYKKNNRNYKSAVFSLLNQMAFEDEDLANYPFRGTVEAAGLTRELCKKIYDVVRKKGFMFRAEIYRKALTVLDEHPATDEYTLIPGEYYTKLEQELLVKLKVKLADATDKDDICNKLYNAMFSDDFSADFRISNPDNYVGFIRANSEMEQYVAVKNHILSMMDSITDLDYDDFCVVLGTSASLTKCTSFYSALGLPCISSDSVCREEKTLDGLNLISYIIGNQVGKLVMYYNRHNPDDLILFDSDYKFKWLNDFIKELGTKKDISEKFKSWISLFTGIDGKRKESVEKSLKQLEDILRRINKLDFSLYEYKSSLEQVFDKEVTLAEMVRYFKNILSGRKKNMVSALDDGVILVKMGEYVPPCRYIYFLDLEEKTFLKDNGQNMLLTQDEHDEFNHLVYGLTKEEHLKSCFKNLIYGSDKIFFVIPQYDEGTVISEYVENLLRIYPKNECNVEVLGRTVSHFKHSFYRTFKDIGNWENIVPHVLPAGSKNWFLPVVAGGNPIDFVVSKLTSATKIEAFMKCPAKFIYDIQQPDVQLEDERHFDRGNAFHLYCEKFFAKQNIKTFELTTENLSNAIADYLQGNYTEPELASYFDAMDVLGIFKEVTEKYPDLELNDSELMKYLYFICRCMTELMSDCIPESIRIEVFIGNSEVLDSPRIEIAQGYIDMIFKRRDGSVVLLDFKSGNIQDYKDDIANYSNVQLLIYNSIVKNALAERDFSVFAPAEKQLGNLHNPKACILENDYFDDTWPDAITEAYYISYKGNSGFYAVNGIAQAEYSFEKFLARLQIFLEKAALNSFQTQCNSGCEYCAVNPFCPDRENILSLSNIYDKINWQGPFLDSYPVPPYVSPKAEDKNKDKVTIVQFWEDGKLAAVSDTSHDIVISAGAGAGKTEVLTSRYLNLLLNTDTQLENILCITFTEKAAGEMKKRIFSKIKDTLSLGAFYSLPGSPVLSQEQIVKLEKAKREFFHKNRISTFHSFCLNMLTRFEKEDKDSVRDLCSCVAESFIIREKKIEVLEALIKKYRTSSDIFGKWAKYQVVYSQTQNGVSGIAVDILKLLEDIRLSGILLSPESADLFDKGFSERKRIAAQIIRRRYLAAQSSLIEAIEQSKQNEARKTNIVKYDDEITNVKRGKCKDANVIPYRNNQLLKSLRKEFLKYPRPDAAECCSEEEERELRRIIFDIILEVNAEIEDYKTENSLIELSDYHVNLLALLENKSILGKIRNELKYIMVDEFQDTNWLQKAILDKLHTESNHLFFVGDLKQSIYRFQQCDNQIFKCYRDRQDMVYITFQENFRSVKQIVEFNNAFFTHNEVREYQIIPNTSRNAGNLEVGIPKKAGTGHTAVTFVGFQGASDGRITSKESNILMREQEAVYIARTIASTGKSQYRKWGILVREYTNISYILDALSRMGIPYSFSIKKNFFEQPEIKQMMQALQVLYGYLPQSTLMPAYDLLEFISDYADKAKGFCHAVNSLAALPRFSNVRPMMHQFILQCHDFVRQMGENPEDIICQILRFAQENDKEMCTSPAEDAVRIMTVHSSKGLEFDYLFVSKITEYTGTGGFNANKSTIDFVNYVDPESKKQIIDYDINGIKKLRDDDSTVWYANWMQNVNHTFDSEEKGNLLYVAFTRAKKHLVVTMQCNRLKGDEKADENWLKNLCGNLDVDSEEFHGATYHMMMYGINEIEPIVYDDYAKNEYSCEVLDFRAPKLLSMSVSSYLDFLESDCEPESDYKISDDEENAGYAKANEVGTLVHSFFEKNIHNLHNADSERFELPKSDAVRKQFLKYVDAGLKNMEFLVLIDGADALFTERAMIFRNQSRNLLNGVIDLVVKKGNTLTVLDYKTHKGSELDEAALDRYCRQVRLYAYGLSRLPKFKGFKIDCCLLLMFSDGMSKMIKVS